MSSSTQNSIVFYKTNAHCTYMYLTLSNATSPNTLRSSDLKIENELFASANNLTPLLRKTRSLGHSFRRNFLVQSYHDNSYLCDNFHTVFLPRYVSLFDAMIVFFSSSILVSVSTSSSIVAVLLPRSLLKNVLANPLSVSSSSVLPALLQAQNVDNSRYIGKILMACMYVE